MTGSRFAIRASAIGLAALAATGVRAQQAVPAVVGPYDVRLRTAPDAQAIAAPIVDLTELPPGFDPLSIPRGVQQLPWNFEGLDVGSVTSQADFTRAFPNDSAMSAADARALYGVDGSGVRIGVISDSYDHFGIAEAGGIASGDLPGPGNPNGYTTPVTVLNDDFGVSRIDEGRAMIELIHDIAPGAQIYFHSAFNNNADLDQSIAFAVDQLRLAGCDIIVDDVSSLVQPVWQDGWEARAYDVAYANGIACFTSAGNDANEAYQDQYNPVFTAGFTYHNFDANGNENPDYLLDFTIPANSSARPSLTWEERYPSVSGGGNASDFDMYIFQAGSVIASSTNAQTAGADPWEFVGVSNPSGSQINVQVAIRAVNVINPNVRFYFEPNSVGVIADDDDTNTGTTFASSACVGALSCAAIAYDNPTTVEDFSSRGNRIVTFDFNGNTINETRFKPDITGAQRTNTTFFGSDYEPDGWPNFAGTSAAAPNVAAVAALGLEYAQSQLGVNIPSGALYTALKASTVARGPAIEAGAGLLDAVLLLQYLDANYGSDPGVPGLYVVTNPGQVLALDTTSAIGGNVGDVGAAFYKEFEYGNGSFVVTEGDSSIKVVDAKTFVAGPVVGVTFPAGFSAITAMEYVGNTLYAAASVVSAQTTSSRLVTLNTTTGATTDLGDMGTGGPVTGLAWDGARMFATQGGANDARLFSVNLSTGAASAIDLITVGGSPVKLTGLEFGIDGVLYGLTRPYAGGQTPNDLIAIDKYTGAASLVGTVAGGAGGQYNAITAIPDPGLYCIANAGGFLGVDPNDAQGFELGLISGDSGFYKSAAYGAGSFYLEDSNANLTTVNATTFAASNNVPIAYPVGFNATTALQYIGGTLYGAASAVGESSTPSRFISINPSTGATVDIGPMGAGPVNGMAWDGTTLYATANVAGGARLYSVNRATGSMTAGPNVTVGGLPATLTGIRFGNDGVLYGLARGGTGATDGDLLAINPITGAASIIGPITGYAPDTRNDLMVIPTFPQPNDDCYDTIDVGLGTIAYDFGGSTGSTVNGSCAGPSAFPDLYYRYVSNQYGTLTVEACDALSVVAMQLYLNTTCPPDFADEVYCGDAGGAGLGGCVWNSTGSVAVVPGDEVLIRISAGFTLQSGELTLSLDFDGDTCADPAQIFDGVTPYGMGETIYDGPISCFPFNPNFFYRYNATTTGTTTVTVCDTYPVGGYAGLEVYDGAACPVTSNSVLGCFATGTPCGSGFSLTYSFPTVAGQDYMFVLVTVAQFQNGDITINAVPDCVADVTTTNTNPGDPGYGSPDGTVDGADLAYYVENWLNQNANVADVTTTNTNPGDPGYGAPDGTVDGADLSYYVENWLAGCP